MSGRVGTLVDRAPWDGERQESQMYFVRFDYLCLTLFFDWLRPRDLC